ncbi:hypothetical protein T11_7960 [Trichinella zimbabwensis]|uniref:Uncharacterized protein n=1 Tax=Trichinella zimbabwensis TaxID=268475 RepID=A0A0V1HA78_9BILA|nr:hypothetical protein T11_7960 [Trichinella zimbabwensis]
MSQISKSDRDNLDAKCAWDEKLTLLKLLRNPLDCEKILLNHIIISFVIIVIRMHRCQITNAAKINLVCLIRLEKVDELISNARWAKLIVCLCRLSVESQH